MLIPFMNLIFYQRKIRGIIHIGAHELEEMNDYLNSGVKKIIWVVANPEKYEFNTAEIINLVNSAGGVCSIAHPHTVNNAKKIIPKLAKKGLLGIEVVGNDFHRLGKNSYLGKNNLSEEEFIYFYSNAEKKLKGKIKWKF